MMQTTITSNIPFTLESLEFAVIHNYHDIILFLLQQGVFPHSYLLKLTTDIQTLCLLIEHGAVPNEDILHFIIIQNNLDLVQCLLDYGFIPSNRSFIAAASLGLYSIVECLLLVYNSYYDCNEALRVSIICGNMNIVYCLLKHGAKHNAHVLHAAIEHNNEHGLSVLLANNNKHLDHDCLYLACQFGYVNIIYILIQHGIHLNEYALRIAAESNHMIVVELFISYNVLPRNNWNITSTRMKKFIKGNTLYAKIIMLLIHQKTLPIELLKMIYFTVT